MGAFKNATFSANSAVNPLEPSTGHCLIMDAVCLLLEAVKLVDSSARAICCHYTPFKLRRIKQFEMNLGPRRIAGKEVHHLLVLFHALVPPQRMEVSLLSSDNADCEKLKKRDMNHD